MLGNKVFAGITLITDPVFFLAPSKGKVLGGGSMGKHPLDESRTGGNT